MTQELGPHQKEWIAALRSGKYEQGEGRLRRDAKYCCLGVGCMVAEIPCTQSGGSWLFGGSIYAAPFELVEFLALHDNEGILDAGELKGCTSLVNANDMAIATFSEIADFCEAHPEAVFFEPR